MDSSGLQRARIWASPGAGTGLNFGGESNVPLMTIDTWGQVGIGTSSPTGGRLLVSSKSPDTFSIRAENLGGGGGLGGISHGSLYPAVTGYALGSAAGIHGYSASTQRSSIGVIGTVGAGAQPYLIEAAQLGGVGVMGHSATGLGVGGVAGGKGGAANNGVEGTVEVDGVGVGLHGHVDLPGSVAVYGGHAQGGYAGLFDGNVQVSGTLVAGAKFFQIDHPLDPENKILAHASVESSEMLNIYSGNIVTDAEGNATVVLPQYFEAINRDFRYQLTVIGGFASAIVAEEIGNGRFLIKTDRPRVKVSWQVTGVRADRYAKAHPLNVEPEKRDDDRGRFLHPELHLDSMHGAGPKSSIAWRPHGIEARLKE